MDSAAVPTAPPLEERLPHCSRCLGPLISPFGQKFMELRHTAESLCTRNYVTFIETDRDVLWMSRETAAFKRWARACQAHLGDLGRPFKKCVYCATSHLTQDDKGKYRPCHEERFVIGVIYTFPTLRRDAPGLTPWKPEKWAKWWRTSGARTSGSHHAVAFVLSLWAGGNVEHWRRRGFAFDVVAAWGVWDDVHRNAFLAWTKNPWRP